MNGQGAEADPAPRLAAPPATPVRARAGRQGRCHVREAGRRRAR